MQLARHYSTYGHRLHIHTFSVISASASDGSDNSAGVDGPVSVAETDSHDGMKIFGSLSAIPDFGSPAQVSR